MQIGRKSIKKQTRRQSGEMKGRSEGRRLEFSTSVTLAGLSIMCDVVESERWSESSHVYRLQARSQVFHKYIQDRKIPFFSSYFCVALKHHTESFFFQVVMFRSFFVIKCKNIAISSLLYMVKRNSKIF